MADQDQIISAPIQQIAPGSDLGCQEHANSKTLRQLLEDSVQKADTFEGNLETARVNIQQSVDALEAQYLGLAEKLTGKVEQQH